MNDEEYIGLVTAAVDGTLTEAEKRRLDEYLAAHPEVRDEYHDMLRAGRMLSEVRPVGPPRRLRGEIMRAIRARQPHQRHSASILSALDRIFGSRRARGFSYRVAIGVAGVAVAIALVANFRQIDRLVSSDQVSGTMAPAGETHLVATQDINEGSVTGRAFLRRTGESLALTIDVHSPTTLTAVVTFDPDRLAFASGQGVASVLSDPQTPGTLRVTAAGSAPVLLTFQERSRVPSDVTVQVLSSGKALTPVTMSTGGSSRPQP